MKKILLSAAIASAVAAAAVATPQDKPRDPQDASAVSQSAQAPAKTMRGSVTSIDNAAKSFVMKDEASGREVTVYWTGSTKVNGDLKVGSMVSIETNEESGRTVANAIDVTKKPY